jgi:hypothetical protein
MAKSMDFPSAAKKRKYSDNLEVSSQQDNPEIAYVAVPGPQGERGIQGPKGERGPEGQQGLQGPKGDPGKDGRDGKDGKDGISILSPSMQNIGWGLYSPSDKKLIRTGADEGDDGWVSLTLPGSTENAFEDYLPRGCVGLWNYNTQKINLRTLNIGSIITIRYNIEISTFMTNTEIWLRTHTDMSDHYPTTYVGSLKYMYDYDISVDQTFFLESRQIQTNGCRPQIRTDNSCSARLKSMFIAVS